MTLEGFDASIWQAGVVVAGGPQVFGLAKASEGLGYKDPAYDRHIQAIRGAGLIPGAYHFARPDLDSSPQAECDWFLTVVGDSRGMLLALDAESDGGSEAWCRDFMGHLSSRLNGHRGLFYSYLNWIQTRGIGTGSSLGDKPLWLAWPNSGLPTPAPWSSVTIQQYGTGRVVNLSGEVDLNRYFGSQEQLAQLVVGGSPGDFLMALSDNEQRDLYNKTGEMWQWFRDHARIQDNELAGAAQQTGEMWQDFRKVWFSQLGSKLDNLTTLVQKLSSEGGDDDDAALLQRLEEINTGLAALTATINKIEAALKGA